MAPYLGIELPNPFRTPAVQNIESRYSAGGGSQTHLPGAATKRGDYDNVVPNIDSHKGVGTKHFQEKVADQKGNVSCQFPKWCLVIAKLADTHGQKPGLLTVRSVMFQSGPFSKTFNEANIGSDKGK